jgi:6-phosphofructokinase 2
LAKARPPPDAGLGGTGGMKRARVVTLTLNPAIDISSEADKVLPTQKTRTYDEAIEPGGGGINVARVLHRLGVDVCALFLGGGATGRVLDELLDRAGVDRRMIAIAEDTRISLTVVERSSGHEFRFVPQGPGVTAEEAESVMEAAAGMRCDYFVASGSLPRGVPADFYARLCKSVSGGGGRFVLDTSGDPLRAALDAGGLFLVKPDRGEFEGFVGRALATDDLVTEADRLVRNGKAENVAITLGQDGAVFADRKAARVSPAIPVEACSAVGAGDSFLAGMVYGFAAGRSGEDSFKLGLGAGAAAVLSCGSELGKPADLKRLVGGALSGEQVDDLGPG